MYSFFDIFFIIQSIMNRHKVFAAMADKLPVPVLVALVKTITVKNGESVLCTLKRYNIIY